MSTAGEYRTGFAFSSAFKFCFDNYQSVVMDKPEINGGIRKHNLREGQKMSLNMNTTAARSNHLRDQLSDMMEPTVERSKEALETMGAATTEATEAIQNTCSAALKGIQEYNSKVLEFSGDNARSYMEFVERLVGVKSPFDFVEICHNHSRGQLTTLAEQAKELATLAQAIAGSATEPLKTGIAKATRAKR